MAIELDPEKALKTGQKWGDVLGKVIVDTQTVMRDAKQMKAAANAKVLKQNEITAAKNAVIRAKNEAKLKAQQEAAFMAMSHSEREIYKKQQMEEGAKASVKKANHDEFISVSHILLIILSIVGICGLVWAGAVILHR